MSKEITAVKNGRIKIFPEATWSRLPGGHGWEPLLAEPEDLKKATKPKPTAEAKKPKQDGPVDE